MIDETCFFIAHMKRGARYQLCVIVNKLGQLNEVNNLTNTYVLYAFLSCDWFNQCVVDLTIPKDVIQSLVNKCVYGVCIDVRLGKVTE